MSGLCGIVSVTGAPVSLLAVERMAAAAPHRGTGPTWFAASGAVVQQRRGRPAGPEGSRPAADVVVAADARIDNEVELRRSLLRSGHLHPASAGDQTALLTAGYLAWGEDLGERLLGDFVVVVWDRRRGVVLAARDPMAMRNLSYRLDGTGSLVFGTEAKQVLAAPGSVTEVDEATVLADLVGDFGRTDRSFFRGVQQLAPGCTLLVSSSGSTVRRSWDVDPQQRLDGATAAECAEELRRVFVEAVEARLDPRAPTGVLLSGGVDSGSVASTAGWLLEREPALTPGVRSYSWAFTEHPECDERHVSRIVVERYGFAGTDVVADGSGPLACYPEHAPDPDDPFLGGFQPLIEHALGRAREDGVGVLLGGDRGDLVIGDSGLRYLDLLRAGRWDGLRTSLREQHDALGDGWGEMVRRHLLAAVVQRARRRTPVEWVRWAQDRARGGGAGPAVPPWVRQELVARVDLTSALAVQAAPAGLDDGRARRYEYVFTPMQMRGVAWSERTYARYGLGFADPFSDRRLVELAVAVPQAALNRPGDPTKPLMRSAMRGVMPEAARSAATKVVPQPLFDSGLRRRADLVRSLLADPLLEQRGWVDAPVLRDHFERYLSGQPLDPRFWWALQTETWLRRLRDR